MTFCGRREDEDRKRTLADLAEQAARAVSMPVNRLGSYGECDEDEHHQDESLVAAPTAGEMMHQHGFMLFAGNHFSQMSRAGCAANSAAPLFFRSLKRFPRRIGHDTRTLPVLTYYFAP